MTGCILENVGFKLFTTAVKIDKACYYSKFDYVSAHYCRDKGFDITSPNMTEFNRLKCSNNTNYDMYLWASAGDNIYGILILGGWFEAGGAHIYVGGKTIYQVNIIANYFDQGLGAIKIEGTDSANPVQGGSVVGNIIYPSTLATSLGLGDVDNIFVAGNYFGAYFNNRCVYSTAAVNCSFVGNKYNTAATIPLDVPTKNTIIEPQLHRGTLFSGVAAPATGTWAVGDVVWNTTPAAGGTPGWVCVNRQDTQMRVQANATDTIMEVDATAGMLATDIIGITLDDDSIHWSTINAVTDGDTLVLDDAIPVGRNAPVDADVFTNRWKAMANLGA